MKSKYVILAGFSLIVVLLLVSCQSEIRSIISTSPTVTVTYTSMPKFPVGLTRTPLLPTITATAIVKKTSVSDAINIVTTSTEIATLFPTSTTPTIVVETLTPLPTLADGELELAIEELLTNPMNCDVPCWWGSVPGETTVFEVQQFLTLHQFEDYYTFDDDHDQIPDYVELRTNEAPFDFRVRYGFENNVLVFLTSGQGYPISDVIEKFGQPDEVLISATNDPRQQPPLIRLTIVYLKESMAFRYIADGDIQGDLVKGCFANETGSVRLNTPNSTTSTTIFKDFSNMFFPEDFLYLSLEKATDLAMEGFMQQFSDPTQSQCIETPTELWE